MSKIVIVDYKLSNLFSVKHACDHVGLITEISAEPSDIEGADAIILPGVGAFNTAMENLSDLGLTDPIIKHVKDGKPFFGICLGLQLLFTESEEFGAHRGLDLVQGKIKKFPSQVVDGVNYKVPQISWNRIRAGEHGSFEGTPLTGVQNGAFMYFVHSFYAEPEHRGDILTVTDYSNIEYSSGILKNKNIFAVQFHPEKSGEKGLQIYQNWAEQNNLK